MARHQLAALTGALMLTACTLPAIQVANNPVTPAGTAPGPGTTPWPTLSSGPTSGQPRAAVQAGVMVTGAVKVPAGIIAAGGGNLVAAGGMNHRVLLAVEEQAAANCEVYLADAAGNPIPGLEKVKTDDKGNFTIAGVPADFTFVVCCDVPTKDGKKATFQSLAKPGKLGATCNLDAGTTLVAADVLAEQKGGDLGDFNPATFKTAAETTAKNLAPDKLPDFADRAAVRKKMTELIGAVKELGESLGQIRAELREIKKTLEDLKTEIQRSREPQPTEPTRPGEPPRTDDPTRTGERPPIGERPPEPRPTGTFAPTNPHPTGTPATTTQPPPRECVPASHNFVVPYPDKVAYLEFKVPTPEKPMDQWINRGTAKREVGYWADIPEGCPHLVLFKNAEGMVVHRVEKFTIPVGAPKEIRFDMPPTTTATPHPTTTPSPTGTPGTPGTTACTEPRVHVFRVRATNGYHLAIDVPNSDPVVHAGYGTVRADGTWEIKVPEGCAHDVKLFDKDWHWIGGIKGHVFPVGAPREITLAI